MSQPTHIRIRRAGALRAGAPCASALFSAVSLAALLGCSGDVVNLGEDASPRPTPPSYSRCVDSPTLAGDVIVSEQAQLDELEGCETIEGDLYVQPLFYPDLRPLHDLKAVGGVLAFSEAPRPDGVGHSIEEVELIRSVSAEWLASFEGMESLERVGSLTVSSATAPDLSSFSQLRALTGEGVLDLWCRNIRDLEPLAHLQGIKALLVSGSQLASIAALQLPLTLSRLRISGEQLTELGALRSLRKVDTDLEVWGTLLHDLTPFSQLESVGGYFIVENASVLESLHGLENLTSAGQVQLLSNPVLQDLDGLTFLKTAEGLTIVNNERLRQVPDFPALGWIFKVLDIYDNPALEQIAGFSGILASQSFALSDGTLHRLPIDEDPMNGLYARPDMVTIRHNPLLRSFSMPAGWPGGKYVEINDNASLETLGFTEFEAIDMLSITSNPSLRTVDLGVLGTVDTLSVIGNPLLSSSTFDGVRTFERDMAGNAGQPPTP